MAVDRFQLTVEATTRGEQDLARLESAINKFSVAAEKSEKRTKDFGVSAEAAGQKIREAFQNPLQTAGDSLTGLLNKLGPAGAGLTAVGAGAVAASAGIFALAKAFGELYEQQANNALRLGVSINDYALLSKASENAGLGADALVGTMKGLSKALAENSDEGKKAKEGLDRLGVAGTDAFGAVRPINDLLLELSDRFGEIRSPAERAELAIKVFGRAGMEILPLMNGELRQQIQTLKDLGVGWDEAALRQGKATDELMDRFTTKWDQIVKRTKQLGAQAFLNVVDNDAQWRASQQQAAAARQEQSVRGFNLVTGRLVPRMFGPGGSNDPWRVRDESLAAQYDAKQRRDSEAAAEASKKAAEAAKKAADEAAKIAERIAKYNADVLDYVQRRPISTGGTGIQGLNPAGPNGIMRFNRPSLLRAGESAFGGFMGLDPALIEKQREAQRVELDYQTRKIQLLAGPGGELAAVRQITELRLAAARDEVERLQIRRDAELQILEIQRARTAELKADGSQIFDAITAGGGGLANYAKGFGLGIGRTIFSNTYSQFAGGLMGKMSVTSNPESMLGKILQGTPFGANPAAQAGQVQLTAGQIQLQAGMKMLTAASMMGGTGGLAAGGALPSSIAMLNPFFSGGGSAGSSLPASVAMLNPFYKGGGGSGSTMRTIGLAGAAAGAGLGIYSGIQQGGASGTLTALGSAAGGVAAILPALSKTLSLAGPIGGAIAIGATLAMAFLPDPKEARRRSLDEQAKQRAYEDATGVEYATDNYGRRTDYTKRGDTRVYLSVSAMDAQSIIDRQEDIGEAVRQALSSYPPLTLDIKGATLGA